LAVGLVGSILTLPVPAFLNPRWFRRDAISVVDRTGMVIGNASEAIGTTDVNIGPLQPVESGDRMPLPRWARVPSGPTGPAISTEAFGLPWRWFVLSRSGFAPISVGPPDAIGLAADTAFWSALAYCVALRARSRRERIRDRNGQCRGCGYDFSGMEAHHCPECGHERAPEAAVMPGPGKSTQ
jgi:hypothetical protein